MIKKHTHGKKFIAWLLTLSMLLSLVPGMAFGAVGEQNEPPTQEAATEPLTLTYGQTTIQCANIAEANTEIEKIGNAQNAQDAELALNQDIAEMDAALVVPVNTKLTLELNGHTMTSTATQSGNPSQVGIGLRLAGEGSNLTVQDSSTAKTGAVITQGNTIGMAARNASATKTNHAKVTLKSGTLKNTGRYLIGFDRTGTGDYVDFVMDGGRLETTYVGRSMVCVKTTGSTVTINDGEIKGVGGAIFELGSPVALTVNKGKILTEGIIFKPSNATTTINNGEFRTTGTTLADSVSGPFNVNGGKFYCNNNDIRTAFYV